MNIKKKVGLRTRKGKKVGKSQIDSILKNPFYCGTMRTKYGLAEHHYKPLISTALYQQAQDVAAGYHKKPHKKISEPFILRGLILARIVDVPSLPKSIKSVISTIAARMPREFAKKSISAKSHWLSLYRSTLTI